MKIRNLKIIAMNPNSLIFNFFVSFEIYLFPAIRLCQKFVNFVAQFVQNTHHGSIHKRTS